MRWKANTSHCNASKSQMIIQNLKQQYNWWWGKPAPAENRLSLFLAWELCVWLQKPFLVEFTLTVVLSFLAFHFFKAWRIVQYNVCNARQSIMAWFKLDTALYCTRLCTSCCTVQAGCAYGWVQRHNIYWSGTVQVAWTPLSHDSDVRRSTCQNSPSMAAPQNVHEFFVFYEIYLTHFCGTWEQGFISWL